MTYITADLNCSQTPIDGLEQTKYPLELNLVTFPSIFLLYQLRGMYSIWITYGLA